MISSGYTLSNFSVDILSLTEKRGFWKNSFENFGELFGDLERISEGSFEIPQAYPDLEHERWSVAITNSSFRSILNSRSLENCKMVENSFWSSGYCHSCCASLSHLILTSSQTSSLVLSVPMKRCVIIASEVPGHHPCWAQVTCMPFYFSC